MKRRNLLLTSSAILFVLVGSAGALSQTRAGDPPANERTDEDEQEYNPEEIGKLPAPSGAPVIVGADLPDRPAAGKGRLRLEIGGNRRWCTDPDDRVVKPPKGLTTPAGAKSRSPVYTFGYQFTIAAVSRANPAATLLLHESPVFRTATLRQAAKLGRGAKKAPSGSPVISPDAKMKPTPLVPEQPNTLVPYWQEEYRCATLAENFEFDLEPGTYDVYMAFDIMIRSGSWVHRSIGYLVDVPVDSGRETRLEGTINMSGGSRREVELLSSSVLPAAGAAAGTP